MLFASSSLHLKPEGDIFLRQIIDKFYQIRQHSTEASEDTSWDSKCACLMHDPEEMWSFKDPTTANYIVSLHVPKFQCTI